MGIDIGKFLKNPEYEIKITTYRDIFQAEALERDRFGEEYRKLSAAIMMSKNDMKRMGFKPGDRVKLTNDNGSIVVELRESKREEPGGVAFMVNSPWSNALVSGDTGGRGIPEFKNISAMISLAKEEVTTIERLIIVR
ncbi:formylmethanofuran dehydrogenase subunit D [Candidatus Methanoperedens nitroreducens]|uniref:Formylmethanofuran dehydrogenase subunit D n=1 Tax=Candidatus Methanoperedens nitratireducens TaxID=1392998 RepID=A0A062V7Z3_9EURY|nr:molybdopterin dinucleotide binding domain-containing protein [Candidatus Methanoperedens nitroreducens]KCZ71884.1 formylmethanofuran dehydrogenase subunit D [Candidatus Methanoperedens nitroreducens]MDJ1422143.1 molybdopterin dinucleotide binding domain-containing protein [Candidatus Methanoperedens sp.]